MVSGGIRVGGILCPPFGVCILWYLEGWGGFGEGMGGPQIPIYVWYVCMVCKYASPDNLWPERSYPL